MKKTILILLALLTLNAAKAQVTVVITTNNVNCNSVCDGSATVFASGGIGPYTYSWNTTPPQTDSIADSLCAGTYSVIVTDFNGYTISSSVTITDTTNMVANINTIINITCNGLCNGQAIVTVTGSTSPYTYQWENSSGIPIPGENNPIFNNVCVGNYFVKIISSDYCIRVVPLSITQPLSLISSISGVINYNGGVITKGVVNLKTYTSNPTQMQIIASVAIDGLGNYAFTNVPTGQYLVIAKGDNIQYPNTVPTYHDSTNHWQNATIVNASVCDSAYTANISLIEFSTTIGFGSINGNISYGNPPKTGTVGDPIPGIDITLEQIPGGTISGYATTDIFGDYQFMNIDIGTYKLYVDITGLPMDSTYTITISPTDTVFEGLIFYVDSITGKIYIDTIGTTSVNKFALSKLSDLYIYPNPTTGIINIKNVKNRLFEIINAMGQVVYSKRITNEQIDLSSHRQGVYFIRINNKIQRLIILK